MSRDAAAGSSAETEGMSGRVVNEHTLVLGIETSCDETAAALVLGGYDVVSSAVSTQVDLHAQFGGVVPEIAGRAHLDLLNPVIVDCTSNQAVADQYADFLSEGFHVVTPNKKANTHSTSGLRFIDCPPSGKSTR